MMRSIGLRRKCGRRSLGHFRADGLRSSVPAAIDLVPLPAMDRCVGHVLSRSVLARARLSVAPVRYGAGVKGRIVASLALASRL